MTRLFCRLSVCSLAALAPLLLVAVAAACPFCGPVGQTLTGEVDQASMVLYGTLTNPKQGADFGDGTTDLQIDKVIKKHPILGDKKVVTLARYVPVDPTDNKKVKFLVFCDVFKGKIDPYRGVPVQADSDMPRYLEGALAVKDKEVPERLKYFFQYLDNPDIEISNDAFNEFAKADYKDIRAMAKDLPADKIARWLQDPKTPAFRLGSYASLLGHSGKPEDAAVLKAMLSDPQKRMASGVDGVLAAYVMLQPKEGWSQILDILKDPKKDFMLRYAALRAVRFFWEYRPDLVDRKEMVAGVSLLLDDPNIADLAIEDLRKWQRWEVTDRVLGLWGKESHDIPIVRRSILRFALSTPEKRAGEFVAQRRKEDPQMVSDIEELLKLEAPPPSTTTATAPVVK